MTYQRPLLATDLSAGAEAAARLLPRLLAKDARGLVLHVTPAPDITPGSRPEALLAMEQVIGEARAQTEQTLRAWAEGRGLAGWEAHATYGLVGPTIASEAVARGADLIAVGSTGAGRIERALLGSTARSTLRHASVDTLVARGEGDAIRHILLATDFQEPSRLAARRAQRIAAHNGARVTILHAISPDVFSGALYPAPPGGGRFDAAWLKTYVLGGLAVVNKESFGGRADELAIHDRPAHGLVAKARELHADLVVVGSHGAGPLSRMLLGSIADGAAANAPCSVLVVRT